MATVTKDVKQELALSWANHPVSFWGLADTDTGEGSLWSEPGTNRLGRLG